MTDTYVDNLLGQNERIVLTARQHWLVLLNSILVEIFVIFVIIALAVSAQIFFPVLGTPIAVVVALVLLLVPFFGGLHDTLVWWNHKYIITNRRVMEVTGIFNKRVTDSSLEKVNDVKLEQSAMGRMFGYGDIQILTASELGVDSFKRISEPVRFKTAMVNAREEMEFGGESLDLDDIPVMLDRLDNLRKRGVISEEEFQAKKRDLLGKL